MIVEVAGWFVDLTLNQFAEYEERVVIDDRTDELTERGIQLDTTTEGGSELYDWLRATADSLLASQ